MDWMRSARTMSEVRRPTPTQTWEPLFGGAFTHSLSSSRRYQHLILLHDGQNTSRVTESSLLTKLQNAHHVFGSGPCQEAAGSVSPPPSHPTSTLSHSKLQTTDLQATYSNYKNTLQQIAQKIGDIEQEAEEHKYAHPLSLCLLHPA